VKSKLVDSEEAIDMEREDVGTFLIGAGMGAIMAMLFAPSSGTKARAQITKAAGEGVTQVKEARDAVLDAVERSKDRIVRHKEGLANAIKQGSEAYRRAVS
jgi:gas vesicle protein